MDRRDFLKTVVKIAFSFLGISGFLFIFSLRPRKIKEKETRYFFIATLDEMPRREVKRFTISGEGTENPNRPFTRPLRVYVVRTGHVVFDHNPSPPDSSGGESNNWIALLPVCTHLGCMVNYNRAKKEFLCPCHGGRYDMYGRVLGGPPRDALKRLPLKIENGKVFVGIKI
jgi:cytochrome b6-f complex iron-sulfur subunit